MTGQTVETIQEVANLGLEDRFHADPREDRVDVRRLVGRPPIGARLAVPGREAVAAQPVEQRADLGLVEIAGAQVDRRAVGIAVGGPVLGVVTGRGRRVADGLGDAVGRDAGATEPIRGFGVQPPREEAAAGAVGPGLPLGGAAAVRHPGGCGQAAFGASLLHHPSLPLTAEHGVGVCNVRDYSDRTLPEHVFMLLLALRRNPEQWERLKADPSLIPNAIEELLRFDSSVQMTGRVTSSEVEVGGVTLPAGESVLMLLGAANRDPAQYPDPDKLDVSRPNIRPMSLGGGIHFCLGAQLARLEGELVFAALIERFPNLELPEKDAPEWKRNFTLRGLTKLRAVWH